MYVYIYLFIYLFTFEQGRRMIGTECCVIVGVNALS